MTRAEAIEQLNNVRDWISEEAIDMAIEALQTDIVRCKECKWHGHIGCAVQIVDESDRPNGNDFCSFGERRE